MDEYAARDLQVPSWITINYHLARLNKARK